MTKSDSFLSQINFLQLLQVHVLLSGQDLISLILLPENFPHLLHLHLVLLGPCLPDHSLLPAGQPGQHQVAPEAEGGLHHGSLHPAELQRLLVAHKGEEQKAQALGQDMIKGKYVLNFGFPIPVTYGTAPPPLLYIVITFLFGTLANAKPNVSAFF